jgi:hypothetical protein
MAFLDDWNVKPQDSGRTGGREFATQTPHGDDQGSANPGFTTAPAGRDISNRLFQGSGWTTKVGDYRDAPPLLRGPNGENDPWAWWLKFLEDDVNGKGGIIDPSTGMMAGLDWAKNRQGTSDFDAWMGVGNGAPGSPSRGVVDRMNADWGVPGSALGSDIMKGLTFGHALANQQNAEFFDPYSSTNGATRYEDMYSRMDPAQALAWQQIANGQSLDAFNSFGGNNLLGGIDGAQLDRLLGGASGGGGYVDSGPRLGWADKLKTWQNGRLDTMLSEMDRRRDQGVNAGLGRISSAAQEAGISGGFSAGAGKDVIDEFYTKNEGDKAGIAANFEEQMQNRYASALNAEGSANAQLGAAGVSAGASMANARTGAKAGLLGQLVGERGAAARAAQGAVYDRAQQGVQLYSDSLEGSRERMAGLYGDRLSALDARYMTDQDRLLTGLSESEKYRLLGLEGQGNEQSRGYNELMQMFGARDNLSRSRMIDYMSISDQERQIRQQQEYGRREAARWPVDLQTLLASGGGGPEPYRPEGSNNNELYAALINNAPRAIDAFING